MADEKRFVIVQRPKRVEPKPSYDNLVDATTRLLEIQKANPETADEYVLVEVTQTPDTVTTVELGVSPLPNAPTAVETRALGQDLERARAAEQQRQREAQDAADAERSRLAIEAGSQEVRALTERGTIE